ncbi:MAG: DMT family transporter [Planctomycetota bacterium]|jgi:drug/metabolite transporter (DMT)-like permease
MRPTDPSKTRRATLWLLLVTLIWGASFLWTEQGMAAAEAVALRRGLEPSDLLPLGAALFVAGRFCLAWGLLWLAGRAAPASRLAQRSDPALGRAALAYAAAMLSGFLLQTESLGELDASVGAFLTSAYVSFTAILTTIVKRRLPGAWTWGGVALATFGAGFIDGPPQVAFGFAAWQALLSALIFAVGILMTDRFTRRHDPVVLTRVTMGFVAIGALAWLGLHLWRAAPELRDATFEVTQEWAFWRPLVLNAVLANVVALLLINLFQRQLDPVRAAILYSLEPVWTAVWVFVLIGLAPGPWLWLGGAALLVGNLVVELAPSRRPDASDPAQT